jgi:hypothetical protein
VNEVNDANPASETSGVERLVIPHEVLDLIRFMCATWAEINDWAYDHCDGDALMKYPVIQGMGNQANLANIGKQAHNNQNIPKAVKWLLANAV